MLHIPSKSASIYTILLNKADKHVTYNHGTGVKEKRNADGKVTIGFLDTHHLLVLYFTIRWSLSIFCSFYLGLTVRLNKV